MENAGVLDTKPVLCGDLRVPMQNQSEISRRSSFGANIHQHVSPTLKHPGRKTHPGDSKAAQMTSRCAGGDLDDQQFELCQARFDKDFCEAPRTKNFPMHHLGRQGSCGSRGLMVFNTPGVGPVGATSKKNMGCFPFDHRIAGWWFGTCFIFHHFPIYWE